MKYTRGLTYVFVDLFTSAKTLTEYPFYVSCHTLFVWSSIAFLRYFEPHRNLIYLFGVSIESPIFIYYFAIPYNSYIERFYINLKSFEQNMTILRKILLLESSSMSVNRKYLGENIRPWNKTQSKKCVGMWGILILSSIYFLYPISVNKKKFVICHFSFSLMSRWIRSQEIGFYRSYSIACFPSVSILLSGKKNTDAQYLCENKNEH